MCNFLNRLFDLPAPWPLLIPTVFFLLTAFLSVRAKALSLSGAAAAFLLGTVILRSLRFEGLFLLFFFFIGSTLVGKLREKIQKTQDPFFEKKGSVRDIHQVLANGFMALAAALLYCCRPGAPALLMFGAALAESSSDTWAGEIGRLSKKAPVSVKTGKPVPRGMSGGVTLTGTLGGLLGAFLTAVLFIVLFRTGKPLFSLLAVTAAGFLGCVSDSVLGAFLQVLYQDPDTGVYSEVPVSAAGKKLRHVRGLRFIDNDAVNFLSNLFAAFLGFLLGLPL